jgi:hypothetical protein
MALIESYSPCSGGPGAYEQLAWRLAAEVLDQCGAYPASLVFRANIRMSYQVDAAHGLNSHRANQLSFDLIAKKGDSG